MQEDNDLPLEEFYDMNKSVPVQHRFDFIRGNQLVCTLHNSDGCPSMTIKPTEVLERNKHGQLELIDRAPTS